MTDLEQRFVHCQWCGKHEELHWVKDVDDYLTETQLCFNCGFWLHYIMLAPVGRTEEGQRIARINGHHYVIAPDSPRPGLGDGFGGRRTTIRFHDGMVVTTRNLWSQGEIPERFRDHLPDNAEWAQR